MQFWFSKHKYLDLDHGVDFEKFNLNVCCLLCTQFITCKPPILNSKYIFFPEHDFGFFFSTRNQEQFCDKNRKLRVQDWWLTCDEPLIGNRLGNEINLPVLGLLVF